MEMSEIAVNPLVYLEIIEISLNQLITQGKA